jgi:hypothetical protein
VGEEVAVLVDGVGGFGVVVGAEPGDGGGADVAGLEADDVLVPGVLGIGGVAGPEAVVPADEAGPLGAKGRGRRSREVGTSLPRRGWGAVPVTTGQTSGLG